jgi:O-antigen/teichoic acid export membrane protein
MTAKKSLFWTFLAQYSGFCVNFIVSMIMARLLTPPEFGVFAIAMTLTEFLVLIRQFGIGRYIVQTKELDDARLRSALGVMVILCWGFAVVIFLSAGSLARGYGHQDLKLILQVMALAFLLVPFSQPGMALLERGLRFRTLMWINLLSVLVTGLVSIAGAMMGLKALSLAIANVAMQIALVLGTLLAAPKGQVFMPGLSKWREVFGFGGYVISSNLITYLGGSAPTAVLGKIVDIASVGMFSRAMGLITMLKQLLQAAIANAMYSQMARLENEGKSLSWTYLRTLGFGTAVIWSAAAVLYCTATPIIAFLYGAQWVAAGPIMSSLCIAMGLQATVPLYVEVLFIKGRQMSLLKRDLLINGFALANFGYWALHSVEAAALARSADAALLTLVYLPLIIKLTKAESRDVARVLLQGLVVTALSAVPAVLVMTYFGWPKTLPVPVLLALGSGSLVAWLLAIVAVRHPMAADLRSVFAAVKQLRKA